MSGGNRNKRAGDKYELEAQALLRELLGIPNTRRALGAGRKDDIGDMYHVPNTAVQVTGTQLDSSISTVCKKKLADAEQQRRRMGADHCAVWLRLKGGEWRVLVDPDEADRLDMTPAMHAPMAVPAAVAVRHFPVMLFGGAVRQCVHVARLDALCMLPPTWVSYWQAAQVRHAGSAGVSVA